MLRLEDVQVRFKSKLALDLGRDIEILDGDRVGIIGSNGAGKTTLLKAVLGMVNYRGKVVRDISPEKIAVHMQQNDYIETVPIRIILEMIIGGPIKENPLVQEMIQFFEFEECLKKRWKHLSGGQKQRLTLILVLCQESPLTLFDEVTSGLDFETRQRLMDKLSEWYAQRQSTVLITSHYYAELDNLVNKILFLDNGKVIDYGKREELFRKYCGNAIIICDRTDLSQTLEKKHSVLHGPINKIVFGCQNEEEESQITKKLSQNNINYRRSNNDIEIMTINAKAAFYKEV